MAALLGRIPGGADGLYAAALAALGLLSFRKPADLVILYTSSGVVGWGGTPRALKTIWSVLIAAFFGKTWLGPGGRFMPTGLASTLGLAMALVNAAKLARGGGGAIAGEGVGSVIPATEETLKGDGKAERLADNPYAPASAMDVYVVGKPVGNSASIAEFFH